MSLFARIFGRDAEDEEPAGPDPDAPPRSPEPDARLDRRRREIVSAEALLRDVMAAKVLHGWLQNRNQTLLPLSVNLARLADEDRARVADFAAVAANAAGDGTTPDRLAAWLDAAGSDAATLRRFREAVATPPALSAALGRLSDPALAGLGFVVALVAARGTGEPGRLFADYVAARLALPSAAVRSAERRYRA